MHKILKINAHNQQRQLYDAEILQAARFNSAAEDAPAQ